VTKDSLKRVAPENLEQDRINQMSFSCIDDEKLTTNPL